MTRPVLVVDDDPDFREALGVNLSDEGFHPVLAANGDEALARLASERPFALILDAVMPGADWWTIVERCRNDPGLASVHVVLVTGAAWQGAKAQAMGIPTFSKPIDWPALCRELKLHDETRPEGAA